MMGDWGGWGGWGWGMGFGWIFMILFWALVIFGVVALAKWIFPTGTSARGAGKPPLDILKERYARGEITRDQYEQMRRDLES
jgi:putative membrane protein